MIVFLVLSLVSLPLLTDSAPMSCNKVATYFSLQDNDDLSVAFATISLTQTNGTKFITVSNVTGVDAYHLTKGKYL